jgi:type VI secretion system protein ImpJ
VDPPLSTRTSIPEGLRWHEGMLLAPQHFQQLAIRSEALSHHFVASGVPYFYGVTRLAVDEGLLDHKVFRLQALECVLPDGMYVQEPPEHFDLAPYKADAERGPMRINLCIPESAVADRQGVMARHVAVGGPAVADTDPDADEGQQAVAVPRLRPNVRLAGNDVPAGMVAMPVAEVEYVDGAFRLTEFVPPHFKVNDAKFVGPLLRTCKQSARKVRDKANYLLEMIRSPVGSANRPRFERQLNALMAGLPAFELLLDSEQVHPFTLYQALCTLGANVASVGSIDEIPRFPRYDHDNILELFESVSGTLFNTLDLGVQESYTEFRLDGEGQSFTISFREEWTTHKLVLGFMGQPTPEIIAWAENCYIGTDSHIEAMSKNRDIGAKRIRDDQHEGLRRRPGTILYTLAEDLRRVEAGETMHVYNPVIGPNDASPSRIFLYVKHDG